MPVTGCPSVDSRNRASVNPPSERARRLKKHFLGNVPTGFAGLTRYTANAGQWMNRLHREAIMVQPFLEAATAGLALALEGIASLIVAVGSVRALIGLVRGIISDATGKWMRLVWLHYASWIVLALEFALAADIVRTAIAPNWDDIGKLAAIATVRTVLNYFLKDDLEDFYAGKAGK